MLLINENNFKKKLLIYTINIITISKSNFAYQYNYYL